MGIIKKQSVFSTAILYVGFLIGIFNSLVLLPKALSIQQLGLVSVLFGLSSIFYSYSSLGLVNIINKFSNYYKNYLPQWKNDLLSFSLVATLLTSLIMSGLYVLLQEKIFDIFNQKELLLKFKNYVPISGAFLLVQTVLIIYTNTYYKTVWTTFVKEVAFRIYNSALIILVLFHIIDFELYLKLYLCSYIFCSLLLTFYLFTLRKIVFLWRPSGVTKKLWPFIWKIGLISWTGDIIFSIGQNIDVFVIQSVLTSEKTGYYTFLIGFVALIMAPQRALINISFPVLADSWRRKDMKNIKMIYLKSSNNMFLIGGVIVLLILMNTRSVFDLVNKKEYYHQYFLNPHLITLLCTARLIELATGVNASIIYTSRKFSFWVTDFISTIFITITIILFNYIFTKNYGIIGIGYASLFAFSVHNFFRLFYIYYKIKIQPFSLQMIKTFLVIIIIYMIVMGSEEYFKNYITTWFGGSYFKVITLITIRSTIIVSLYVLFVYYLKISEDINTLITQINFRVKKLIV